MEKDKKRNFQGWLHEGIKEAGLESPSYNFTQQILSRLPKNEVEQTQIIYKPLITKNGWVLITFSIITIFTISFYTGKEQVYEKDTVLGRVFDFIPFDMFSELHFSNTVVLSSVLFAVFAGIQIITIKRFLEGRM